jgi:hypothetical protein
MKTYISPKIDLHNIIIEETFTNSSAITKPLSSDDVQTEWEIGIDQNATYSWE